MKLITIIYILYYIYIYTYNLCITYNSLKHELLNLYKL